MFGKEIKVQTPKLRSMHPTMMYIKTKIDETMSKGNIPDLSSSWSSRAAESGLLRPDVEDGPPQNNLHQIPLFVQMHGWHRNFKHQLERQHHLLHIIRCRTMLVWTNLDNNVYQNKIDKSKRKGNTPDFSSCWSSRAAESGLLRPSVENGPEPNLTVAGRGRMCFHAFLSPGQERSLRQLLPLC